MCLWKCAPECNYGENLQARYRVGFVKIRNTKGKAFNPTRGSIFSSHEGPGGHISPRSHSASKRIKSTTFLGTICTEWATNQFSWTLISLSWFLNPVCNPTLTQPNPNPGQHIWELISQLLLIRIKPNLKLKLTWIKETQKNFRTQKFVWSKRIFWT